MTSCFIEKPTEEEGQLSDHEQNFTSAKSDQALSEKQNY